MLVMGLSGGFGLPGERFIPSLPVWFFHDSAASLVEDGKILASIEEERVNRVKHTNMLPVGAARECLETAGRSLSDVDFIAYFFREDYADTELNLQYLEHPEISLRYARDIIAERFSGFFGQPVDRAKIRFIQHHQCHATAAFFHSGFEAALIGIFDGNGEDESISIYTGEGKEIRLLATYAVEKSLGHFYSFAIQLLGYGLFDEYKVMGLAPYGDASVYRPLFRSMFSLTDCGNYELDFETVRSHFLRRGFVPRRRGEAFRKADADFAAALQETLELIVIHVISHWARETGQPNFCIAGGVAQNSVLNGRLAQEGLFQRVFVHPASHDAGAAVGAAMEVCRTETGSGLNSIALRNVYWGNGLVALKEQETLFERWSNFFEFERCDEFPVRAAQLIATGAIIGWAQDRMEFGPRALGNRSILADPRPEENKDRINAAIKKREGYRPFAPSVLAEKAHAYFQIPTTVQELPFMGMTVPVQPDMRKLLGAVTHVDGSARVQTVSKDQNPRFWRLIQVFGELTGVPIVLNTSFNTSVEPIVRTAGEALLCFLTTDLDYLFLNNWLLSKKAAPDWRFLDLVPALNINVELSECHSNQQNGGRTARQIAFVYSKGQSLRVSKEMCDILRSADGQKSFRDCSNEQGSEAPSESIIAEIRLLLAGRFIDVRGLNVSL